MTNLRAVAAAAAAAAALVAWPLGSLGCSAFSPGTPALFARWRIEAARAPALRMSDGGGDSASASAGDGKAPRYDKVFVAGGSRGVGRLTVERLLSSGAAAEVVALVRSDDALEQLGGVEGVTAVRGDAFDYGDVEAALGGCDAAVTTLGGAVDDEGKRIDDVGNNNVIEAATAAGVGRVVLVTSVGCGSSREAAPPSVFEVLKDVLAAKERAESTLMEGDTNWTIIRPGGLKTERATGTAILTEDATAIGSIHREDVADLIARALVSDKTEGKVLSAVDPQITSAANAGGGTWEEFEL